VSCDIDEHWDGVANYYLTLRLKTGWPMSLIDKVRVRSQALLEPGEIIEYVLPAEGGWRPPSTAVVLGAVLGLVSFPVVIALHRPRVIVATDRAIVILKTDWWVGTKPKSVLQRLPRNAPILIGRGQIFRKVLIGDTKLYVHRRRFKDLDAFGLAAT